jgi:hypothetical protein
VRGGNPALALEKEGLDDMALVREIRKRLFVQYQPVEVEAMEREDKTVESRYAFVKIVPESATARGAAWKRQLVHARKMLALKTTKKPKTTKKAKKAKKTTKKARFMSIEKAKTKMHSDGEGEGDDEDDEEENSDEDEEEDKQEDEDEHEDEEEEEDDEFNDGGGGAALNSHVVWSMDGDVPVCTFPTFQKSTKTAADGKPTTVIDFEEKDVSLPFASPGALQQAMIAALDAVSRAVAKKRAEIKSGVLLRPKLQTKFLKPHSQQVLFVYLVFHQVVELSHRTRRGPQLLAHVLETSILSN